MGKQVGIRREDKNIWERRVPITPQHVTDVSQATGLSFCVQSSPIRAFPDDAYRTAGAEVCDDVTACPVVFAVKEIPTSQFRPKGTYVFFAHVVKGQAYNMPMLKRILELECTLIDYEKVADDRGRRLIFFGRHAGLAGMVDTLWALGQRLQWEGISTPFSQLQQTYHYHDSAAAKKAVALVGEQIANVGLSASLTPFVCGFAGYGNVSRGAQEIYDQLPVKEITPHELLALTDHDRHIAYKVVFREVHTVKPIDPTRPFDLDHFFKSPAQYESQFEQYLPHLTVLVNAVYWSPLSPRLVTKAYLRRAYSPGQETTKLRVIGDISCDIEGAIEATVRSTEPDEPTYVYDPMTGEAPAGVTGIGPVIMAVDNLPCELPAESSADFSAALRDFVAPIAMADYSLPFDECPLPPEIRRAVIVYRGQLTPGYRYLEQYLRDF